MVGVKDLKWTPTLIELAKKPDYFISGHRMCAGCAAPVIVKLALKALPNPENVVIVNATGCLEVASTIYPYTSWKRPWIHNAFENAAATASGIEAAFKALKAKAVWKDDLPIVLVFGGDGGTYDIGLQSLSGAVERGHKFVYILYDNEAYMNTGIQRCSSTPQFAQTTTTPAGVVIPGKLEWKKPIGFIIAAHGNAYVATANPYFWIDFVKKVRVAAEYNGPAFIHAISICPRGWYHSSKITMTVSRLATETCLHPLWEFDPENKEYRITDKSLEIARNPEKKVPVEEYLKLQGRFSHLFTPTRRDDIISEIQRKVDRDWEYLLKLAGMK
ncbi:MAG: thiamine pyrophosphate-dependent enzyme [Crenarchaeota archaeon]|nr:thiamine pyrophosphate-dependent enzyme [Thermoproteota archaeon]